jgi:hypothetical protein
LSPSAGLARRCGGGCAGDVSANVRHNWLCMSNALHVPCDAATARTADGTCLLATTFSLSHTKKCEKKVSFKNFKSIRNLTRLDAKSL